MSESLLQRYRTLSGELERAGVAMLAVSKYAPDSAVQMLIDAGHRQFGESRPQHLRDRTMRWPACAWHMIGPVQKNKAKYIGRHAAMWHSCDDPETARAVARHVGERTLPVLAQINIANAPGQRGVQPDAAAALVETLAGVDGLQPAGLMCMAPRTPDESEIRQAFQRMRRLRDDIFGAHAELCMGMSGDFRLAVQEGATMVRLGSVLFAEMDVRRQSAEQDTADLSAETVELEQEKQCRD